MNCNECNSPMTKLDPREITDPQPSRYIPRWRCDEKECPAQGEVVEDDGTCCQCGNKLNAVEVGNNQIMCDRCWEVRNAYHQIYDWDEFDEEEEEVYTCEICGGEYSYDAGWSTCDCPDRWGTAVSEEAHPVTDFTARISDHDPQRRATWRLVFGTEEVPLRSPFSTLAMLPDRGPTEVYDLDVTALTAEQRTRLVLHISGRFGVPAEEVEAQMDTIGCPILAEDVTVIIERPFAWLDFDDDEFNDDDDNELFGFEAYYGDDDDDYDEDLMP